jgi:membrane protein implicated in regulation of membrane protease activity
VSKWIAVAAVVAAGCTVAFLVLDPIIAAFVAILLVTALVVALLARDWDRHPTYEQREQVRAQRRKEKWERGTDARERDRARWEAHQARQAQKAQQEHEVGRPEAGQ